MMTSQALIAISRQFLLGCLLAVSAEPFAGDIACEQSSDSCSGEHSSIFAIAHDWQNPVTEILYRVTVPAWSVDADWTGKNNGFFYQANLLQSGETIATYYYVPFNGIRIGTDGKPEIPAFHFIERTQVADQDGNDLGTSLEIKACSSDYADSGSVKTPTCTTQYWADTYASPLPAPLLTGGMNPTIGSLNLSSSSVEVADNGVYTKSLVLSNSDSLTQDELDWLNDHLVFFDDEGKVYTNDLLNERVGVLSYEESTYIDSPTQNHRTKYGSGANLTQAPTPERDLFFFALDQDPATVKLGIRVIYDKSEDCTGYVFNVHSLNPDCSETPVLPFSVSPKASVTVSEWKPEGSGQPNYLAGDARNREIDLTLQNGGADCDKVLNPLAIYPNGSSAHRPPNYVIDPDVWEDTFPIGLYYVVDTGFGDCDLGSYGPFCHRTDEVSTLYSYIPHYSSAGAYGVLNGGSTSAEHIDKLLLADQYALGDINDVDENLLVYFDSCGYGHTYTEDSNSNLRQRLPAAPSGWSASSYTISNQSIYPLNIAKECCASWYQSFTNDEGVTSNVPPHKLDNGFGMFVGTGQDYETLFKEEAAVVYDALSGEKLYKLRLYPTNTQMFACTDPSQSAFVQSGQAIRLGDPSSGYGNCNSGRTCPLNLATATSGSLVSCTKTTSSFLLGLDWWANQIGADAIQLMAWGGGGHSHSYCAKYQDGVCVKHDTIAGSLQGFSMTVLAPGEFPSGLNAYVGLEGGSASGGSSTLVTGTPLSFTGSDGATTTHNPKNMDVYLIAGGGGSSGDSHSGGQGGIAIANASNPPGADVSIAGSNGGGDNGGTGGNQDGLGAEGGHNAVDGVGGTGHDATWQNPGNLILPNIDPLPKWNAGHGSHGNGTGGGGGFGGGAHASGSGSAGAGGGGSWARGNSAHDSTAPTSPPSSPGANSGKDGAVRVAYVNPTGATAPGPEGGSLVRFTYQSSLQPLDLSALVNVLFGKTVSGELPLCIEAWGGPGGKGATQSTLSRGGRGGYAATCLRLADLPSAPGTPGGQALYLYVGEKGSDGEAAGEPGQGGASTLVSTRSLNSYRRYGEAFEPDAIGLLALAGGGGGGGTTAEDILRLYAGRSIVGGCGGIALGRLESHISCGGELGGYLSDPSEAGAGGNGGGLLCSEDGTAGGGAGGNLSGGDGMPGLGGFGGLTAFGAEPAGWVGVDLHWDAGRGGDSSAKGGAGGGGLGGGGAGGTLVGDALGGAGGAGAGSWSRRAWVAVVEELLHGIEQSPSEQGAVVLTFHPCAADQSSPFCTGGFTRVDSNLSLSRRGKRGLVRALVKGSADLDVSRIDPERIGFGPGVVAPIGTPKRTSDVDGDGFDDLQLQFSPEELQLADGQLGVHCLYMAQQDGTPLLGCARLEASQ